MASQKMFIGERNYNGQDAVKLFWEAITIMVKEFYSSLHIDIRSRIAITGLGYFAAKYADRKGDRKREGLRKRIKQKVMMILAMVPYISLIKFIERELVDTMEMIMKICAMMFFAFLKHFLFINKKKVWSEIKPYLFGRKLASEEKYLTIVNGNFRKLKFKRISTRERKGLGKQKLKKYFLFKAY
uniref:Uncharacterized protein n=1 Tax=Meloidogyne enterolobii TaxID=390850 RepID=A0A6V7V2S3_MELEN|nr:unnamed protein product [Meloidogyne enterolobii]